MLTRQVAAALDRWGILPDDSAGRPLPLTAPGRLLRHVSTLFGRQLTAEALLTVLKHPLTATGASARGPHLLATRDLELHIRRRALPFPSAADLRAWARGNEDRAHWVEWIVAALDGLDAIGTEPLAAHVTRHIQVAETLAAGPGAAGSGELWREEPGRVAWREIEALLREADAAGAMPPDEYASLFHSVFNRAQVRETVEVHPNIMIWAHSKPGSRGPIW